MRILAIDPSLRSTGLAGTGWAESVTPGKLTGHERLEFIRHAIRDYARGADLVVMEGPALGAKGRAVHQLAGGWWLTAHQVWRAGVPYAVIPPTTLKIYATGNGRASKDEVSDVMRELHPNVRFDTDDESDAYTLLTMAHHHYGAQMMCCGGSHAPRMLPLLRHGRTQEALESVDWPDIGTEQAA